MDTGRVPSLRSPAVRRVRAGSGARRTRGAAARRAGRGTVALASGALSLLLTAGHAAPAAARGAHPGRGSTVWLCRPGLPHDPCAIPFAATSIAATGSRTEESAPSTAKSAFDCFYVYPTVSSEPRENADLVVQRAERDAAIVQASPFSQMCDVWAPMYRQTTLADVVKDGIAGLPRAAVLESYDSLLDAWRAFVAEDDDGRPIILIGHSQGAALLIRLVRQEIDPDATLRARLVVAILAGGNLQVPDGKTEGATFKHVPLCTETGQSGCAIAWSSFPSKPPAGSPFGRPGEGVSVQAGETATRGQRVACTNPAALSGGPGSLVPYFVRAQVPALSPASSTLWVTFPGLYHAQCAQAGGATWLQVGHRSGTGRPVVAVTAVPGFGYHADDVNLVLGNLLEDVAASEAAYRART